MKMILLSFSLLTLLLLLNFSASGAALRQPMDLSMGGNHTASPHDFSRGKKSWEAIPGLCISHSRMDTLPPPASLHAPINTFHAHAAHSSLLELQESRRGKEALLPYLGRHLNLRRELATALQLLELDRELLSYWQQELAAKSIGQVEFLAKRKDFLEKEAGIDRLWELEAEIPYTSFFYFKTPRIYQG